MISIKNFPAGITGSDSMKKSIQVKGCCPICGLPLSPDNEYMAAGGEACQCPLNVTLEIKPSLKKVSELTKLKFDDIKPI